MKVIVCGSRTWEDREAIRRELFKLPHWDTVVIHGAARGADKIAGEIAEELGFEVRSYPARWEALGGGAGLARNKFMLELGPDKVLAFARKLMATRGTLHMVLISRAAGVPVEVFSE